MKNKLSDSINQVQKYFSYFCLKTNILSSISDEWLLAFTRFSLAELQTLASNFKYLQYKYCFDYGKGKELSTRKYEILAIFIEKSQPSLAMLDCFFSHLETFYCIYLECEMKLYVLPIIHQLSQQDIKFFENIPQSLKSFWSLSHKRKENHLLKLQLSCSIDVNDNLPAILVLIAKYVLKYAKNYNGNINEGFIDSLLCDKPKMLITRTEELGTYPFQPLDISKALQHTKGPTDNVNRSYILKELEEDLYNTSPFIESYNQNLNYPNQVNLQALSKRENPNHINQNLYLEDHKVSVNKLFNDPTKEMKSIILNNRELEENKFLESDKEFSKETYQILSTKIWYENQNLEDKTIESFKKQDKSVLKPRVSNTSLQFITSHIQNLSQDNSKSSYEEDKLIAPPKLYSPKKKEEYDNQTKNLENIFYKSPEKNKNKDNLEHQSGSDYEKLFLESNEMRNIQAILEEDKLKEKISSIESPCFAKKAHFSDVNINSLMVKVQAGLLKLKEWLPMIEEFAQPKMEQDRTESWVKLDLFRNNLKNGTLFTNYRMNSFIARKTPRYKTYIGDSLDIIEESEERKIGHMRMSIPVSPKGSQNDPSPTF